MIKAKLYRLGENYRCIYQINTESWALPLAIHWIGHSNQEDLTIHILIFKVNIFLFQEGNHE
jgi:hypothetical protein